jgi:hypothetical protein
MARIVCGTCGNEHDLGGIDPAFSHPDAFFEMPAEERPGRVSRHETLVLGLENLRSRYESREDTPNPALPAPRTT